LAAERVALLTGTNRGAGHGIAAALHAAGFRLISLNRTIRGCPWLGEIECDLSDATSIAAAMAKVADRADRLDVCVLNAAIRRLAPIGELRADDWLESVATNLTAPFLLTKATLPAVRKARGLYVFVGSHAATRFFEGGAAYCGTKAGLKALVEILLLEERAAGVRAVLVSPGAIANRPDDFSPAKISPESLGSMVTDLILRPPEDIVVGEIELRPAVLKDPPVAGISRLQSV